MGSPEFHAERATGLGGSDIGAMLGLNPYKTQYQLWLDKTGRDDPFAGNLQTRFGTYAEQFVAEEYTRQTGRKVQRFKAMLRHPKAPLIGHVDRLVIPDGAKVASVRGVIKTDRGLEAKTAHALATQHGDEWGDDGTDRVPPSYLVQCAAYMALTGCNQWDLACLFGNSDFRVYTIHRDAELEEMILEESTRWWRDHVVADVPPDPQNEIEARQRWTSHIEGKSIEVDSEMLQAVRELSVVKETLKTLEGDEKRLRDMIVPALGDCEALTLDGLPLLTYRANKPGSKTDWQAIADELLARSDQAQREELIARHTIQTPGARVLRLIQRKKAND